MVNLGLLAVLGGGMFALNAWALYEPRAETVRVGIAGYWWMLITVLPHAQAYLLPCQWSCWQPAERSRRSPGNRDVTVSRPSVSLPVSRRGIAMRHAAPR